MSKVKTIYVNAGDVFQICVLPKGHCPTAKGWHDLRRNDHLDIYKIYQFMFEEFNHLLVPRTIRPAISVASVKWIPERNIAGVS